MRAADTPDGVDPVVGAGSILPVTGPVPHGAGHPGPGRPRRLSVTRLRRLVVTAESLLPLLPRVPPRPAPRRSDAVGLGIEHPTASEPGGGRSSADTAGTRRLSVVVANVARTEGDGAAQARALLADDDLDLLVVVERTADTVTALDAAGLAERLPHRAERADEGFFGALVASRHPVAAAATPDLGGRGGLVVDLDVDGDPLRVVAVHTQAPIYDADLEVWHTTIAATAAVADEAPGPVLLAGDWNATGGHRAYRRALARHGLVDAQATLGWRWWPTWPVARPVAGLRPPPFLALDHVVHTPDLHVADLARHRLPASDHLALTATVTLPPPPTRP